MSHAYYDGLWRDAMAECRSQVLREMLLRKAVVVRSGSEARKALAFLYIKYVSCLKKLDECCDQIVQPQKRVLLRSLLDAVVGRLVELKQEMTSVELCDVQFLGDFVSRLGIAPDDVEIPVPNCYYLDGREDSLARESRIKSMLARAGTKSAEKKRGMTREETIIAIQTAERFRQARARMKLMREMRRQRVLGEARPTEEDVAALRGRRLDATAAATVLQKSWRGRQARRRVVEELTQTKRFLQMLPLPAAAIDEELSALRERRRQLASRRRAEHEEAAARIRLQVENLESGHMEEELQDRIRCWYVDETNASGKVPDFPAEDVGGSMSIFKFPELIEEKIDRKVTEDALKKERPKRREEGYSLAASKFFPLLHRNCARYEIEWENYDLDGNREEETDEEMILREERALAWRAIRGNVDEDMRLELEQLRDVIERDKTRRTMTKKRAKKVKRRAAAKAGKKRREKDLTADRTVESLLEELVVNGIIKLSRKIRMKDAAGDIAIVVQDAQYHPHAGDIRRTVAELCILPLASAKVHELCPYTRSILLAGPKGCGKHMWVDVICTELGATLFDLTAANIVGKYPGRAGLKMLLHLVNKVSRATQPSVIVIDCAERTFMKKVPRHDRTEPKRLKKDLPNLVKGIGLHDRVLLVGLSSEPWLAEAKGMNQVFQRMVLVTRPDCNTRRALWTRALSERLDAESASAVDTTALAEVSDGYSCESILRSVGEVLTQKRVQLLPLQKLVESEFLEPLSKMTPIDSDEEDMFSRWYRTKSVMGRRVAKRESEERTKKKNAKRAAPRIARAKK